MYRVKNFKNASKRVLSTSKPMSSSVPRASSSVSLANQFGILNEMEDYPKGKQPQSGDGSDLGPIQPLDSLGAVVGRGKSDVDSDSDVEEIYDETADFMKLPNGTSTSEGASTPGFLCSHG